ncbi:hypothetical protein AC482_04745 [miscellaneous Crenarchaeota group-15 archaeon DG-45]|uniref:Transglutaminase-like domain-containing protein n=1 Tax=miscellaneous Crenarchaeota group-15 archaeon DG-45 TaxID=1685127 RepID=A0A0M0BNU1_9ARCH|nr:MAG: hypothetical protein AC482_04745 [miscellaneous Crenarchaeota group-15 archaeon DG-45]
MKGKAATLLLIVVVFVTPFITGYLSVPSEVDDVDDMFFDIQKFWISLPRMIILHEHPFKNEQSNLTPAPNPEGTRGQAKNIILKVRLSGGAGQWMRDPGSGLPAYDVMIHFDIYNYGTDLAEDAVITIGLDDEVYQTTRVDIGSNSYHRGQLSVRLNYDSIKNITLKASCDGEYDSDSLEMISRLPRTPESAGEAIKLYMTPGDSIVAQRARQIIDSKPFLKSEWEALRDWIEERIEYRRDEGEDYWQIPRETLALGEGDFEDQAILLASMLRTCGYDPDEVYVIWSEALNREATGTEGRAWVLFRVIDSVGFEKWQALEAMERGFNEKSFDLGYDWEIICGKSGEHLRFNDVVYEKR